MARVLALIPLVVLVAPASCLQCKSCQGEFGCSVETDVTCSEGESSCRTAVRTAAVSFLRFQTVSKGCASRSRPDEALALSSHLLALSYRARHCQGDRCNAESLVPEPATPNQLSCHACTSQGAWCPPSARTQLVCTGTQDQCLDLEITGSLGEFTNMKLKGCASLPRCQDGLGFHAGSRAIHARCCDTPLCNHLDTDFHVEAEPHNGLQCYSCVDEDGGGCSSNSSATVPCMGHHNMCLEGIGRTRTGGADSVLVTFKGCATPAMCQSSLLALVQELDDAQVYCCTGSLCNTRIMDGRVVEGQPSHPSPAGPVTCLTPSPSHDPTPEPDCILEEDEEEDVIPVADGVLAEGAGHGATNSPSLFAAGGSGTESSSGSGRESFVAGGSATVAPYGLAAASGVAHSTNGPTPGSPGSRIDTVVHIPYLTTRQNESFFSEDREGGSSQPGASPASPTGTVLAAERARPGSQRGKNKTLCTKRPGVGPVGQGLSSQDMPARAHPGALETVAKPQGSLEHNEGDRDWPTISFPITVETPNSSLQGHLGNASAPGLDPVEGLVKNTSEWLYTDTAGKPRPPYPSGAFGLGSNFGLVTLTLLLAVLLH